MFTFDDLRSWIDKQPDQFEGNPSSINSQTKEPYVEFYEGGLARPGDEAIVESFVAELMLKRLVSYFNNKSGPIYWRTKLEAEVVDYSIVLYADENGPDIDFITDTRCVKDHNWKVVRCYCRLLRSSKVIKSKEFV